MSGKKKEITPTQFVNVFVTAIPTIDPTTKQVTYKTTFTPEALLIQLPDTVINYQLISPTPAGVTFDSIDIVPQDGQMSVPTIGTSGKLVTFSDANTKAETFNVTLHFKDSDGIRFSVDPEVGNDPKLTGIEPPVAMATLEPETGNDPRL